MDPDKLLPEIVPFHLFIWSTFKTVLIHKNLYRWFPLRSGLCQYISTESVLPFIHTSSVLIGLFFRINKTGLWLTRTCMTVWHLCLYTYVQCTLHTTKLPKTASFTSKKQVVASFYVLLFVFVWPYMSSFMKRWHITWTWWILSMKIVFLFSGVRP